MRICRSKTNTTNFIDIPKKEDKFWKKQIFGEDKENE